MVEVFVGAAELTEKFAQKRNRLSKKKLSVKKKLDAPRHRAHKKYITVTTISLLIVLSVGTVLGFWRNPLGTRGLRSLFVAPVPPPAVPAPGNPSKEYIYAGGKLIATEEPQPLAAPVNLVANTFSGSRVDITWTPSPAANHYQVERTQNITTAYTIVSGNVTATSFNDNTVSSGTAYLYRVRAVDSSSNLSPPSNIDLATAIEFADDPLVSYSDNPNSATPIKAIHLNQLRQAVNAVRALAGLAVATWTYPDPVSLPLDQRRPVYVTDLQDLRTNLDTALSALGLTVTGYTDPSLSGVRIQKVHINEIRQRVK